MSKEIENIRKQVDGNRLLGDQSTYRALQTLLQRVDELESDISRHGEYSAIIAKRMDDYKRKYEDAQKRVEKLEEVFNNSTVYHALRYYFKQGLFEPEEYEALEQAMHFPFED